MGGATILPPSTGVGAKYNDIAFAVAGGKLGKRLDK